MRLAEVMQTRPAPAGEMIASVRKMTPIHPSPAAVQTTVNGARGSSPVDAKFVHEPAWRSSRGSRAAMKIT